LRDLFRKVAIRESDGASSAAVLSAVQVVIQAAILFATYRIAVSNIGLATLGLWSVASAASTFGRVGDLGFSGAVPRLLAERVGTGREDSLSSLVQTAALSSALGTGLLALGFYFPLLAFTRSIATAEQQHIAGHLVLAANATIVLTALSLAFQACLDGLGRFRTRVLISIFGSLINFSLVWLSINSLGALALPLGSIIQALVMLIFSWIALRNRIKALPAFPRQWHNVEFKKLFQIGKFTQANSVLIILFEPMSRVLAGHYGSAEFAALFDLAAKVAGNIRLIFSSAAQALTPFFSASREAPIRAGILFVSSTSVVVVTATAATAMGMLFSPLVSIFSLNRLDPDFLSMFWILLLGNLGNVMGAPAFFFALGAGTVGVSTRSLTLQAVIFICAATVLNLLSAAQSIPVAYALAVVCTGTYSLRSGILQLKLDAKILYALIARTAAPLAVLLLISSVVILYADPGLISLMTGICCLPALVMAGALVKYWRPVATWRREIRTFQVTKEQSTPFGDRLVRQSA
jgi:O-antigen/teichoic acid export membrane protein